VEYVKLPMQGSVDLDGKPFNISDNNVRKTKNLIPDKAGNLQRRGAILYESALINDSLLQPPTTFILHRTAVGTPYATDVNVDNNPPIWMGVPDLGNGRYIFGTCHNGTRFDLTVSATDKQGNGSASFNIKDTVPDLMPSIVTLSGVTYIVYGPNPWGSAGVVLTPSVTDPNGFIFSDLNFAGTENKEFRPDVACEYKGRVIYGLRDGRVVWSDRFQPLVIGDGALQNRSAALGSLRLGKLVGLRAVMLDGSGSLATSGLLAVFQYGCKLILGEPLETTETGDIFGDLQINNLSDRAGCVSAETIVNTDWGTMWVGVDDVWMMPYGSVPIPIGRHIKPILQAQPENMRFRIHAVLFNGFYRVALFSDGQGPSISDPLGEQWWLDLRDGPPKDWTEARWFGPQIFKSAYKLANTRLENNTRTGTYFMVLDQREGRGGRLYGCDQGLVPDVENARERIRPVLVTYDNPSSRDIVGHFAISRDPWTPNELRALGDQIIVLFDGDPHPLLWEVTTAGVTAVTPPEPAWLNTPTITDGAVEWTLQAILLCPFDMYGSEILTEWDSKEYDFGTRMFSKLLNGMEVNMYNSAPEWFRFRQIIDGGKASSNIDKYLDQSSGPILGADVFKDAPVMAEEYKSISARPDESLRRNGNSVQYRIEENTGIVIPEAFRTFGIVDASNRTPDRLTLLNDYYTDLSDLVNAILTLWTTPDSAFYTKYGENWHFDISGSRVIVTNDDFTWAPPSLLSPANRADRFIWSLLGFDLSAYTPAFTHTGNAMPFDVLIGLGLGFEEATGAYHPFRRRPQ
jgi:hypothetical protein